MVAAVAAATAAAAAPAVVVNGVCSPLVHSWCKASVYSLA